MSSASSTPNEAPLQSATEPEDDMDAHELSNLVDYLTAPATTEQVKTNESAQLADVIGPQNEDLPAYAEPEVQHTSSATSPAWAENFCRNKMVKTQKEEMRRSI